WTVLQSPRAVYDRVHAAQERQPAFRVRGLCDIERQMGNSGNARPGRMAADADHLVSLGCQPSRESRADQAARTDNGNPQGGLLQLDAHGGLTQIDFLLHRRKALPSKAIRY